MSTQLIERYESFSLAASDRKVIAGLFDFVYFEALPAGVTVSVNGEPHRARQEGSIRSGVAGRDDIQSVEFLNTTGGALTVSALFGNGSFEISGQVTVTGSLPLATGASTSAKQDTGNTSLASILAAMATAAKQDTGNTSLASILAAVATAAKQDTGNNYLQSLVGPSARTARILAFTPSASTTISGARQLGILNTSTTVSVTVNDGTTTVTVGPGQGVDWPLIGKQEAAYQDIIITCPASAAGLITWVT